VVVVELSIISLIRWKYMDTPFYRPLFKWWLAALGIFGGVVIGAS